MVRISCSAMSPESSARARAAMVWPVGLWMLVWQ